MALQIDVHAARFGIDIANAYVKIETAVYTASSVIISLRVWPSQDARNKGRSTIADYTFSFPRNDATEPPVKPMAHAYGLVKAMDQFSTAADV